MRERIIIFIETENLAPTKFADEIGVQRSSVSHILSGRNNPSFDFIQKILTRYKALNAEWLIMGTGPMYKAMEQGDLFASIKQESVILNQLREDKQILKPQVENKKIIPEISLDSSQNVAKLISNKEIEKILIIYTDKTFAVYIPES